MMRESQLSRSQLAPRRASPRALPHSLRAIDRCFAIAGDVNLLAVMLFLAVVQAMCDMMMGTRTHC
jgi:hypothetical protein